MCVCVCVCVPVFVCLCLSQPSAPALITHSQPVHLSAILKHNALGPFVIAFQIREQRPRDTVTNREIIKRERERDRGRWMDGEWLYRETINEQKRNR